MKLIMQHSVGDGDTWYYTSTIPIEYESKEKLMYHILELTLESIENKKYGFNLGSQSFRAAEFGFDFDSQKLDFTEPSIYTLEEWFEQSKIC